MAYLTKKKVKMDLSQNDICIYISDRAGRKTSVIQDVMIEEWAKNEYNPIFMLLRTKTDENITESWFSDYVIHKYEKYKFYHKKVNNYITVICAKVGDEEKILCFNFFVSVSQKYKSSYYNGFEFIKYVIWEECVPENRLTQNIDVINKSDEILNKVFSISSTVCRQNKPKFIFLGNDIEYNFLNPITVKFNMLDKIVLDKDVSGNVFLYNDLYKFNFYYFSFKNSVNHWKDVQDLTFIKDLSKLGTQQPFIFILNNTKYYLYENDITINVIELNNIEESNEKKLILKYFPPEVAKQYFSMSIENKQVFLELLRFRNMSFNAVFNLYYDTERYNNILVYVFKDKTEKTKTYEYELDKILNDYNYTEIIENCLPLYNYFKEKFLKKRMYSNFAIKTKFEKLMDLILKSFIDFN